MASNSLYLPNASEVIRGAVELATTAEVAAGTSKGATGARLVAPNDALSAIVGNASETAKGVVELATDAEVAARTSSGSTGARLVEPNSYVRKGCRLRKSASQTSIGTGAVVVTWDTEDFDTDNMHSTSSLTSQILFNTAGKYLVIAELNHSALNAEMSVEIKLNNTTFISRACGTQATFGCGVCVSTVYNFNVNDYIEVIAQANVNGDLTTAAHFEAYSLL